jgi:hypothetical protein
MFGWKIIEDLLECNVFGLLPSFSSDLIAQYTPLCIFVPVKFAAFYWMKTAFLCALGIRLIDLSVFWERKNYYEISLGLFRLLQYECEHQ